MNASMSIRLQRYGKLLGVIALLAGCDVKDRTVGVRHRNSAERDGGTDGAVVETGGGGGATPPGGGGATAPGGGGAAGAGASGSGTGGVSGSPASGGRPGAGGSTSGGGPPSAGGDDAGPGCDPETDTAFCKRLHATCGDVSAPDNCGADRKVTCGTCTKPDTCGAGNTCVPPNCVPETVPEYCARLGKDCGVFSGYDNCGVGRSANCGTCMAPKACGTDNVCACVAESNTAFCSRLGKDCGNFSGSDNCGAPRNTNCGSCTPPKTCGANNVCACVPENATAFCNRLGKECNSVTAADNCGTSRTYNCGSCTTAGEACGNKNLCVVPLACMGRNEAISLTFYDFTGSTPPTPAGGTLVDGFYASTKITAYGTVQSAIGGSLEIRSGFIRRVHTTYNTMGSALTGWTENGTYTVAGTTITDTVDNCTYGGTGTQNLSYTSSSNQIRLFDTISNATVVTQYDLQP